MKKIDCGCQIGETENTASSNSKNFGIGWGKLISVTLFAILAMNHTCKRNNTEQLEKAILASDARYCEALINSFFGTNVNAKYKDGMTPLHLAVKVGNAEICNVLIDAGADLGTKNNDGKTPLDLLLENNKVAKLVSQHIDQKIKHMSKEQFEKIFRERADEVKVKENKGKTP
ncbi:MAG: ankyrin repeat domain-containing protein [Planctomycetaceae bacterium]|nr:ankyrin repeat domain-containing protein [Planctomycetaceae bacterium]